MVTAVVAAALAVAGVAIADGSLFGIVGISNPGTPVTGASTSSMRSPRWGRSLAPWPAMRPPYEKLRGGKKPVRACGFR